MLYKKYHRNYIRQFKKGAKVTYKNNSQYEVVEIVIKEPFIFWDGVICVECEKSRHRLIPFYDGKLNIGVYVV